MKNKNTPSPKTKTKLRLGNIILYTVAVAVLGGIIWKLIIGTAATVVNPTNVLGMFTPASGSPISGYSLTKTITIDKTKVMDTVDLVDFPLLVSLTDPDLKSVTNGGYVNNVNGYDIVFSGTANAQLDHQLESYDPATGKLVAWVRLPILYTNVNTELNISCGNSTVTSDLSTENVWNSSYEAVWHMADNPTNSELNDAAGSFNGQSHGNMTNSDLVEGQIGLAIDFDGNNDYFSIQNKKYNSSGAIPEITVSSWIKTNFSNGSWSSNWSLLDFDRSEYFNFYVHGQGKASFSTRGSGNSGNSGINDLHGGQNGQINDGNWHYMVGVYDGTSKYIYIDGVLVITSSDPHNGANLGSGTTRYGIIGDGSEASCYNGSRNNTYYSGKIDELRLHNQAVSAGWIATEYNNQSSPETFYTLSTGFNLPIELISFTATLNNNEVTLNWSTATERENDYFTVERSSDGSTFETIGKVDGAGNSQSLLKYSLLDSDPMHGVSYYRLKQTDFNGASETFLPVAVKYIIPVEKLVIEKVWPNPFTSTFTVNFSMNTASDVEIALTNLHGAQVFADNIPTQEGDNTYFYYPNDDLIPGIYFLNIMQDGEILASKKLIKQ